MEKHILLIETERNSQNLINNLDKFIALTKPCSTKQLKSLNLSSMLLRPSNSGNDHADARSEAKVIVTEHSLSEKSFTYLSEDTNEHHTVEDNFLYDDYFKLSEELHTYLDRLGEPGSYMTYIILCIDNYLPQLSELPDFYGVLKRIEEWHRGSLFMVTSINDIPNDWASLLQLYIVPTITELAKPIIETIWRGSFEIFPEGENQSEILPEITFKLIAGTSIFHNETKNQSKLYMSETAEVMTQIDVASIPWAFIKSGGMYSISPSITLPHADLEELEEFIKTITHNAAVATLFRIKYSCTAPTLEGVAALTTEEWKKCLAEGQFDIIPELTFKESYQVANFLILTKGFSENDVLVVSLHDLSACGDDVIKLILKEAAKGNQSQDLEQVKKIKHLMESTPCYTPFHMTILSSLSLTLPQQIKEILEKKGQSIDKLWDDTKCLIESLSSREVLKHVNCVPTVRANLDHPVIDVVPEAWMDKTHWPEYQALLQRENQNQKMLTRFSSGDMLGGLAPPPHPEVAVVTLDAGLFLQMFKPDGQPSDKARTKMEKYVAKGRQYPFKATTSLEEAKKRSWPDSLHTRHHDIYYNYDAKREAFEERCFKLPQRYVRNETASTCSLFNEKEAFIPKSTNNNKPDTKKLPSTSKSPKKDQRRSLRQNKTIEESEADTASVRSGRIVSAATTTTANRETGLRTSPRKKMSNSTVDVKPSDLLKPSGGGSSSTTTRRSDRKVPVPANLTELHKQKLRVAIITCLETEGVKMKDPIFKVSFKKLFNICTPFAIDVIGCGSMTKNLEKICKSHVKQVIEFEKLKLKKRTRR